ncbi:MAG: DMT family transporter [Candidatus Roizmanbacteria bacterium]|nr:DMT family transporter [Candidatus Roizmanbacteria bacterium]
MSSWIVLSLFSAIFGAIVNLATKQVSNNAKLNEYSVAWLRTVATLPVLWIVLFAKGMPVVDSRFWLLLFIMIPLEIATALCYFKAIKISPLSLITPITSLNILFIAIGAYFILGENLTIVHGAALLLFVLGIYVLNFDFAVSKNILYPFAKLTKEKGVLLILLFCLIVGINVPIQKMAILYSSSQFFAAVYFSIAAVPFTFLFLTKGKATLKDITISVKAILVMGIFNGLYLFAGTKAVSTGKVAFVTAVVSLNILLTIILSGTFLKEKGIFKKFIAGLIMVAGAALIAINP